MAVAIEFGSQGSAASSSSVATISSLDFNAEASDRIIAAAIAIEATVTITGVTIGGVTAAQRGSAINTSGVDHLAEIWTAAVPAGTDGSVVVTVSTGDTTVSVATFSITGADATPTDSDTAVNSSADISITALTIATGGAGITCWCNSTGGSACTWTGASESHDTDIGGAFRHSSAIVTAAGTNTITADGNTAAQSLVGVAWGPASGGAATSLVPPVDPVPPSMFPRMAAFVPQYASHHINNFPFSNTPAPPAASLIYRPTFFDHMIIR